MAEQTVEVDAVHAVGDPDGTDRAAGPDQVDREVQGGLGSRTRSARNAQILRDRLLAMGHVLSCVHVTGGNCYELTVAVRDAQHLEQIIEHLSEMGDTTTGAVLSEPVHPRDVDIAARLLRDG
ncbi:Lrp/AsnC ligand binding domain-containing protein [Streptomyces sp. HB2AG]|uniref:Lrp/AsnC ligand binding domain-containing protein n=1 Tax=Streptomyces sp. HB2AG TaxID=2983400 RepID=UPI0022AAAECB|nr:Lrp/AsnC ligand binding domain-containing protein [Streptomyces sp. HB2AG]MCZ2527812.1 Lrp/AsnC ligand binding domain-containing protein [Streptomyces sp. HB2AG]